MPITLYPTFKGANGFVGINTIAPTERLQVAGVIHSTTGGIKYPDGTVQTTAAYVFGVPAGTIILYAGGSPPTGYLWCNGEARSRTTYSALFSAIGTTYGSGDGSTTFNMPDLRGQFVRGLDQGRGVDPGRALGSAQVDEIKVHNHRPLYDGGFFGSAAVEASSLGYSTNSDRGGGSQNTGRRVLTIENTGGTETRPKNVALIYLIKV